MIEGIEGIDGIERIDVFCVNCVVVSRWMRRSRIFLNWNRRGRRRI
jgi:hypothetical protein